MRQAALRQRFCMQAKKWQGKDIVCYKRSEHSGPHVTQGLTDDNVVLTIQWYDPYEKPAEPVVKVEIPPSESPIQFMPPTTNQFKETEQKQRMMEIEARNNR